MSLLEGRWAHHRRLKPGCRRPRVLASSYRPSSAHRSRSGARALKIWTARASELPLSKKCRSRTVSVMCDSAREQRDLRGQGRHLGVNYSWPSLVYLGIDVRRRSRLSQVTWKSGTHLASCLSPSRRGVQAQARTVHQTVPAPSAWNSCVTNHA